jgi:hypothetical protein
LWKSPKLDFIQLQQVKNPSLHGLYFDQGVFRMSPIQRGELENIMDAQIAGIVVLSRHLK